RACSRRETSCAGPASSSGPSATPARRRRPCTNIWRRRWRRKRPEIGRPDPYQTHTVFSAQERHMTEMTNIVARMEAERARLEREGMYRADEEHDSCGVGFVAAVDGKPARRVVTAAIEALKAVWHRGAVDADGKTGDGAGIHLELPRVFFEQHIENTGHTPRSGHFAVGMIFLPRGNMQDQETCRQIVESEIIDFGYGIYGWRQVPVNTSVIGQKAALSRPEI